MDGLTQAKHDKAGMQVFSDDEWRLLNEHFHLSGRQREILRALYTGLDDKHIAAELEMSYWILRAHLKTMYLKFGTHDRNELILEIFRQHLDVCEDIRLLHAGQATSDAGR